MALGWTILSDGCYRTGIRCPFVSLINAGLPVAGLRDFVTVLQPETLVEYRGQSVAFYRFDNLVHRYPCQPEGWHRFIGANAPPVWKGILPKGCLVRQPAVDGVA
jgi:hypothetical protein